IRRDGKGRPMGDRFPQYQAAAVQMAAVWMDREATTEKVVRLIQEASARGGQADRLPGSHHSRDASLDLAGEELANAPGSSMVASRPRTTGCDGYRRGVTAQGGRP